MHHCFLCLFAQLFSVIKHNTNPSLCPTVVNYDVSTAKNLLLLAVSQEEQQKWVGRLVKKIPKKPPAPEHFARSSPRSSMKVQPSQSMRRPSRQLPPSKSR